MAYVPLRAVQHLLGHHQISTTERYSHLSPEFQRSTVDALMKLTQDANGAVMMPVSHPAQNSTARSRVRDRSTNSAKVTSRAAAAASKLHPELHPDVETLVNN